MHEGIVDEMDCTLPSGLTMTTSVAGMALMMLTKEVARIRNQRFCSGDPPPQVWEGSPGQGALQASRSVEPRFSVFSRSPQKQSPLLLADS